MDSADNTAELFEMLQQAQAEAEAAMQPWQRDLKPGDFVMTDTGYGLIYSEILVDEENRGLGYSRVKGYSPNAPNGEYGYVFTSTFAGQLTPEQFAKAKQLGWPSTVEGFKQVVEGDRTWFYDKG